MQKCKESIQSSQTSDFHTVTYTLLESSPPVSSSLLFKLYERFPSRDVLPFTLKLPDTIASARTSTELEEVAKLGAGLFLLVFPTEDMVFVDKPFEYYVIEYHENPVDQIWTTLSLWNKPQF